MSDNKVQDNNLTLTNELDTVHQRLKEQLRNQRIVNRAQESLDEFISQSKQKQLATPTKTGSSYYKNIPKPPIPNPLSVPNTIDSTSSTFPVNANPYMYQVPYLVPDPLMSVQKSNFDDIVDLLFTPMEKKDFLISLGYIMDSNGNFRKDGSDTISYGDMNSLFTYEITIKFKNLLLAKPILKIKI